jgi:hypothetical protein
MDRKILFRLGLCVFVLLGLALLPAGVRAGSPNLPPRPPFPGGGGGGGDGDGGGHSAILLHISAGQGTPADGAAWAALWTLVQWQDGLSNWHDVDGWQGPPAGSITDPNHKSWPVEERLFAKGPFRWVVKQGQSGAIIGASGPFYLPHDDSEVVKVDVKLDTNSSGAGNESPPIAPAIVLYIPSGATAELWTVVQWGDGLGAWYDIVRWEGPLDSMNTGAGRKAWPVESILLGRGVFRWLVYQGRGGPLVASSNAFNLPSSMSDVVQVDAPASN